MSVRAPAVAGSFYPSGPVDLLDALDAAFADARQPGDGRRTGDAAPPKAIVVPHAGYPYSGPIAASAYRLVEDAAVVDKVVLIGPSHRVPFVGLAVPSADAFETPLGAVPVDAALRDVALTFDAVVVDDRPHAVEHSLEVQVPFLQRVLGEFTLLPIAAGYASADEVGAVLDGLWGGDETLIVVSTDLSHYRDYETAAELDRRTADAVVERRAHDIADVDACGAVGLRGLLVAAQRRDATVELIDLRSSGDTAGDRSRVVGYGAFAVR